MFSVFQGRARSAWLDCWTCEVHSLEARWAVAHALSLDQQSSRVVCSELCLLLESLVLTPREGLEFAEPGCFEYLDVPGVLW